MTSEERLMAAISLERPDRVPIAFALDTAPAAKLAGRKSWELVTQGFDPQLDVVLEVFDDFGGWDGVAGLLPPDLFPVSGMRAKPPSEGSPENQVLEGEVWTPDEYDLLVEIGWERFVNEQLVFRVSDMTRAEEIRQRIAERREELRRAAAEERGGESEGSDYQTAIRSMMGARNTSKENDDDQ